MTYLQSRRRGAIMLALSLSIAAIATQTTFAADPEEVTLAEAIAEGRVLLKPHVSYPDEMRFQVLLLNYEDEPLIVRVEPGTVLGVIRTARNKESYYAFLSADYPPPLSERNRMRIVADTFLTRDSESDEFISFDRILLHDSAAVLVDLQGYWLVPGSSRVLVRRPFAVEVDETLEMVMRSFSSETPPKVRQAAVYIEASGAIQSQVVGALDLSSPDVFMKARSLVRTAHERDEQEKTARTQAMPLHKAVAQGLVTVAMETINTPEKSVLWVNATASLGPGRLDLWIAPGTVLREEGAEDDMKVAYLAAPDTRVKVEAGDPVAVEVNACVYEMKLAGDFSGELVVEPPEPLVGAIMSRTKSVRNAQIGLLVAENPDLTFDQMRHDPLMGKVASGLLVTSASVEAAKRSLELSKENLASVTADGDYDPTSVLSGQWIAAPKDKALQFRLAGVFRYVKRRGIEGSAKAKMMDKARRNFRRNYVDGMVRLQLDTDGTYDLTVSNDDASEEKELSGKWYWTGRRVRLVIPEFRADEFPESPPFTVFAFYEGMLNGGKAVFGETTLLVRDEE